MGSKVKGVVLHPASLPGRFGVGDLGPEAWHWLDVLGEAGVGTWVLPVDVEELGLLSFDMLHQDGALLAGDMAMLPVFDDMEVNVEAVHEVRWAFLHLAARRFVCQCEASPLLRGSLDGFSDDECIWLDDAALFGAIQDVVGRDWRQWPEPLRLRSPEAMDSAMVTLEPQIEERRALHYLLSRQWKKLKTRAEEAGVRLAILKQTNTANSEPEHWQTAGKLASETRVLQHGHILLEPGDVSGPDWLQGDVLFDRNPETHSAHWRFRWSDLTETVLKRLV